VKFSILLFVLMQKIKWAAKKRPAVQNKVKEKNFTIVIKTEDGARGRYFTFSDGAVKSGKGDHPKADVSLIWKDAGTGFKVMIRQSDNAFVKAMQKGTLKIQGDPNCLPTFMGIVKAAMKPAK
jgi:hypothetical protein